MHVPISELHAQWHNSMSLNSQRFLHFHPTAMLVTYGSSCFIIIRQNFFPVSFSSRISSKGRALKEMAPSGGRHENIWGISCEKSRFYAKKIIFFPILGGARRVSPPPLDPPLQCTSVNQAVTLYQFT